MCALCLLCTKNTARNNGIIMIPTHVCRFLFCFAFFHLFGVYRVLSCNPWLKYHCSSVRFPHTWKSTVSKDNTWACIEMRGIVNSSCSVDTLPLGMGLHWRGICQRSHLSDHSQLTLTLWGKSQNMMVEKWPLVLKFVNRYFLCEWPLLSLYNWC